jgi:arylformamidase
MVRKRYLAKSEIARESSTAMTIKDHAWHELQYLPSLTVANAADIAPSWRKRAAITREKYPPLCNFKYGPHPREAIDLFRVKKSRGTLVYIHGGYWRSFSKLETSFVAESFVEQGYSVALINYPLCPDVPLPHIRHSALQAFAHLYTHILSADESKKVVVSGHSAGGHLAALHLATDWRRHDLPQNPISGVISLSGVFDVSPLLQTSINTELRLTEETAEALNIMSLELKSNAKLVLAVGSLESEEFHRQSADLAHVWVGLSPQLLDVDGYNHYTIVDSLAERDGVLHRLACDMLSG